MPVKVQSSWFCPKCGKKLVLREGRFGRFMACPGYPECEYTRALWTYQGVEPHCEKCNGTGLLPFIKNGKVIPYAFIDCACKKEMTEHYQPLNGDDFDFPCSYLWRAYYTETQEDKQLLPLSPREQSEIPTIPLSNKNVLVKMDKVLAESRYWNKKTVELFKSHLDKKRNPKKYKEYTI